MFDTIHEINKANAQEIIAKSLHRIANALECMAFPHQMLKENYDKHCKEKDSWEKQARYYCDTYTDLQRKLRKSNNENKTNN